MVHPVAGRMPHPQISDAPGEFVSCDEARLGGDSIGFGSPDRLGQ
jgi:hypothetical protein